MAHTIADELRLEQEKYSAAVSAAQNEVASKIRPFDDFGVQTAGYKKQAQPFTSTGDGGGYSTRGGMITPTSMGGMPPTSAPITFNPPTMGKATFNEPVMGEMPTFTAPEYDEGKVSSLTQKHAAAGTRKLRSAVQESMARRSENPNVNRMTLRDALAGYGEGLESVMSGASKTAGAEYAQKYAMEYKTAGMNYQTAVQAVRDKYQGQMGMRQAEFQAEMQSLNTVYAGEIQAEQFRVSEERRTQSFDYMYDQFKKGSLGPSPGGFTGLTYTGGTIDDYGRPLV